MNQESEFTIKDCEELLKVMKKYNRNASIDWINRSIVILSDPIVHPTKTLSGGKPLIYRDYWYHYGN